MAGVCAANGLDSHGHECRYRRATAHPHHVPASRSIHPGIRAMARRYRAEMPACRAATSRNTVRARCADDNPNGPDRPLPNSCISSSLEKRARNSGTARSNLGEYSRIAVTAMYFIDNNSSAWQYSDGGHLSSVSSYPPTSYGISNLVIFGGSSGYIEITNFYISHILPIALQFPSLSYTQAGGCS